jgi:hypothetical protein
MGRKKTPRWMSALKGITAVVAVIGGIFGAANSIRDFVAPFRVGTPVASLHEGRTVDALMSKTMANAPSGAMGNEVDEAEALGVARALAGAIASASKADQAMQAMPKP